MRRAARTDGNQQEIVAALRAVGVDVLLLFRVGHGCPDLLAWVPPDVGRSGGRYVLIEVKSAGGTLTPDEEDFVAAWGGPVAIVRSASEALAAVGVAATETTTGGRR